MEECKYCKELFTGWMNDSLIQDHVNLECGFNLLDIDVFINDDELELFVDNGSCDEICKKTLKINYCPMCGRRLVREQNNLSNGKEV